MNIKESVFKRLQGFFAFMKLQQCITKKEKGEEKLYGMQNKSYKIE